MSQPSNRRLPLIITIIILLLLALLLFVRCKPEEPPAAPAPAVAATPPPAVVSAPTEPVAAAPAAPEPEDVLTPATLEFPPRVNAGKRFPVKWTGPNNARDYITVVKSDQPAHRFDNYRDTKDSQEPFELLAPIEPGDWEVRYVAGRARTILGRAPLLVTANEVTITAPAEVVAGTEVQVAWTGPDNERDYITFVPKDVPDGQYRKYSDTRHGPTLTITAPIEAGPAELRYMTGQGAQVLHRVPVLVVPAPITIKAPAEVVAGTPTTVVWTGPNNEDDYITFVPRHVPDGRYGKYSNTRNGSPLTITAPIEAGPAELRYMAGQGAKVLHRIPVTVVAARITLDAPASATAESRVTVNWTGPNNEGDYITIVPKDLPEGRYAGYSDTSRGPSLTIKVPKEPGPAEIRYVAGQGSVTLARKEIQITP